MITETRIFLNAVEEGHRTVLLGLHFFKRVALFSELDLRWRDLLAEVLLIVNSDSSCPAHVWLRFRTHKRCHCVLLRICLPGNLYARLHT